MGYVMDFQRPTGRQIIMVYVGLYTWDGINISNKTKVLGQRDLPTCELSQAMGCRTDMN